METKTAIPSVLIAEMSRNLYEGPAQSAIQLLREIDRSRYIPYPVFSLVPEEHSQLEQILGFTTSNFRMPRPRITLSPADLVTFASGTASATRALQRLILKERISLAHANSIINMHAAIAAGRSRIPFVLTVREMLPDRGINRNYIKWICSKAAAVITVSSAVKERLLAAGADGTRMSVIHNGIDILEHNSCRREELRSEWKIPKGAKVAGIVGTVAEMKGHHVLLAAAELLASKMPGLYVVIIGEPQDDSIEYAERISAQAESPALKGRVVFAGRRRDARQCMSAFDIYAQPSVRDDSLPRTVLEAMAAGTPVAGSRVGGIPEMVRDGITGVITEPGDAEALADVIEKLLSNDELRASMGVAALEEVKQNFDCAAHAGKVMDVYDSVLNKR